MNYKIISIIIILIFLVSGAFAYTGFHRYYYTDNYEPNVYYSNPASTPTYPTVNTYSHNRYSYEYTSPTYVYNYSGYYPYTYYGYPNYRTVYPVYTHTYVYPESQRSISIHGENWGITYSEGSVCTYYGYC